MTRAVHILAVSILLVGQVLCDGANPFNTGGGHEEASGGPKSPGLAKPKAKPGSPGAFKQSQTPGSNGVFGAPQAFGFRESPGRKKNNGGGNKGQKGGGFPLGKKQQQSCGGKRQECCANSQCNPGLECLNRGDENWIGLERRCIKRKVRGNCGLEGLRCCGKNCLNGLVCAGGRMCRKPQDSIVVDPNAVGQTVITYSGWVLVRVRARGGKCFVKVTSNLEVSVSSYGEGTFGEVFGSLNALGECEEDAKGRAIGYIREEVLATAVLNADGECVADAQNEIELYANIQGEGISVGLGANTGATVGCYRKRKLLFSDFV
ncbi:hypothetical protein BSKO_13614 [Bryopsis sp. KO-2023]|nr:hypothetical protein BSKO_13614 [Bryopsis sp. KO-2023]